MKELSKIDFAIKWIGTVILVASVFLTAFNVYPLNVLVSFIGSSILLYIGWKQREYPYITIMTMYVLITTAGLINAHLVQLF